MAAAVESSLQGLARSAAKGRITWDEANIAAHDAVRGIEFGTMKIDQADTPFLYMHSESASRGEICSGKGPALNGVLDGPPPKLTIEQMQDALGLVLEAEASGAERFDKPKFVRVDGEAADSFAARRAAHYRGLGQHATQLTALAEGLPEGWSVEMSRSEPKEPYYRNEVTDETSWDRPTESAATTSAA